MRTSMLVLGMVLLVVGLQGAVRQLIDHENAGLLGWLPGGPATQITAHVAVAVGGVILAARGDRRAAAR
ncbi:hypothetical protein [Kineococcus glutinatus]|uniref:Uncharacterized protein n=1 Tax=Kineococcus glutinatus TaxID=1070872 RepID=A0ABP9HLU4_9ACTN